MVSAYSKHVFIKLYRYYAKRIFGNTQEILYEMYPTLGIQSGNCRLVLTYNIQSNIELSKSEADLSWSFLSEMLKLNAPLLACNCEI